jgi:hypothetical protein
MPRPYRNRERVRMRKNTIAVRCSGKILPLRERHGAMPYQDILL